MDDLRAMREARFGETEPRAKAAPDAPAAPKRTKPARTPEAPDQTGQRRCGHRAISGRSCTREHGHEEKSHRYS